MPGQCFGAWTVIAEAPRGHSPGVRWRCRCACGQERDVYQSALRSGDSKSCGCLRYADRVRKHGHTGARHNGRASPEYRTWQAIQTRCYKSNSDSYPYYGGRGIAVCDRWRGEDGFINFVADMGNRPSKEHSIDRIDNNGDYSPDNCRWATTKEQMGNRSDTVRVRFRGVDRCVSQVAADLGVAPSTLQNRLAFHGDNASIDQIRTPLRASIIEVNGVKKHLVEWAAETGILPETISARLTRGWSAEDAVSVAPKSPNTQSAKLYPVFGELLSVTAACRKYKMRRGTVLRRVRNGMSVEEAVSFPAQNKGFKLAGGLGY